MKKELKKEFVKALSKDWKQFDSGLKKTWKKREIKVQREKGDKREIKVQIEKGNKSPKWKGR